MEKQVRISVKCRHLLSLCCSPFMGREFVTDAAGITLVGFVRGERMNIYTGPQKTRLQVQYLFPYDSDFEAVRGDCNKGVNVAYTRVQYRAIPVIQIEECDDPVSEL